MHSRPEFTLLEEGKRGGASEMDTNVLCLSLKKTHKTGVNNMKYLYFFSWRPHLSIEIYPVISETKTLYKVEGGDSYKKSTVKCLELTPSEAAELYERAEIVERASHDREKTKLLIDYKLMKLEQIPVEYFNKYNLALVTIRETMEFLKNHRCNP